MHSTPPIVICSSETHLCTGGEGLARLRDRLFTALRATRRCQKSEQRTFRYPLQAHLDSTVELVPHHARAHAWSRPTLSQGRVEVGDGDRSLAEAFR